MEANFDQEAVAIRAPAMQVDDSVKSRIVERIKAQMSRESVDSGPEWPPIYLKAPDDWP